VHIEKICSSFSIVGCGFDRWGGVRGLMADLLSRHILSSKEIPQHEGFLSAPSTEYKLAVLQGVVATLDNPVLRWNMSNCQLENNLRGGMMPHKANGDPHKKIDAVSASVNAWYLWKDPDFKPAVSPRIYGL
jgi:phage terminase large subunit-like protein